jgi:formate dehydrogenase subunit beta
MKTDWILTTGGQPLETVRRFIASVWQALHLEAMILPLKDARTAEWQTEVITDPDSIQLSNPFTPLMVENIARHLPAFLRKHPGQRVAALLRPCEVRAFEEIQSAQQIDTANLVILSADCLGTFPAEEFSWRLDKKGSADNLSDETLHFSRSGGIAPYRYRIACQLCRNPIADGGDINLHIVGVPVRDKLLVSANGLSSELELTSLSDRPATSEESEDHARIAERMVYRNQQTNLRLAHALTAETDLDLDSLVDQLNDCGPCQACLNVCPICTTREIQRDPDGQFDRQEVADWIVACVGCGMCEESCPNHRPLSAIFSVVREKLAEIYN